MGELGLHPWELDEYSMQDFIYRAEGLRKIENARYKDDWEKVRQLGYIIAQSNGAKKGLTKYDIMTFTWDEKQTKRGLAQITDQEERKEYAKALADRSKAIWDNFLNNKN